MSKQRAQRKIRETVGARTRYPLTGEPNELKLPADQRLQVLGWTEYDPGCWDHDEHGDGFDYRMALKVSRECARCRTAITPTQHGICEDCAATQEEQEREDYRESLLDAYWQHKIDEARGK